MASVPPPPFECLLPLQLSPYCNLCVCVCFVQTAKVGPARLLDAVWRGAHTRAPLLLAQRDFFLFLVLFTCIWPESSGRLQLMIYYQAVTSKLA